MYKLNDTVNEHGDTYVHLMALSSHYPLKLMSNEYLTMKNKEGESVIHALAMSGTMDFNYVIQNVDESVLKMKDKMGNTYYHYSAYVGNIDISNVPADVLHDKNVLGESVLDIVNNKNTSCKRTSIVDYFPGIVAATSIGIIGYLLYVILR